MHHFYFILIFVYILKFEEGQTTFGCCCFCHLEHLFKFSVFQGQPFKFNNFTCSVSSCSPGVSIIELNFAHLKVYDKGKSVSYHCEQFTKKLVCKVNPSGGATLHPPLLQVDGAELVLNITWSSLTCSSSIKATTLAL